MTNETESRLSTLCVRAVDIWGESRQVWQAVEELGELLTALARYDRGRNNASEVIGEIADVKIMCEQLSYIFSFDPNVNLDETIREKLSRLEERLNETHKE